MLAVLVSVTVADCSDGVVSRTKSTEESGANLATVWEVLVPDPSHLLIFHKDQGTISHELLFVEFGRSGVPAGIDLPTSFVSATLVPGGKQLDCTDDKGKAWSYVIDGATSLEQKVVLAVKGLSELNDPNGWDLSKSTSTSGSGWDVAGLLQVRDPAPDPAPAVGGCASGGPGSTNCSQTVNGMNCSVGCGSGYYSCCYMNASGSPRCRCVEQTIPK